MRLFPRGSMGSNPKQASELASYHSAHEVHRSILKSIFMVSDLSNRFIPPDN